MKLNPARRTKPHVAPASRDLAILCARSADDKKAERILVLDVTGRTSIADYLLIATASSRPHLRAVANAVVETIENSDGKLHHREGSYDSPWLLLDCYDIIVHIFDDAARRHYDLERLWTEAPRVAWREKVATKPVRRVK